MNFTCAAMEMILHLEDNRLWDELQTNQAQINALKERQEAIQRRREELALLEAKVNELTATPD